MQQIVSDATAYKTIGGGVIAAITSRMLEIDPATALSIMVALIGLAVAIFNALVNRSANARARAADDRARERHELDMAVARAQLRKLEGKNNADEQK
jgi:hypothetical protein